MHIGPADVGLLLSWFHHRENKYDALVIYLSRGDSGDEFIKTIVSERHKIDLITKDSLALIVTSENDESSFEIKQDPHRFFFPGTFV